MYDTTPIPESKLPPVYVRKERKRHKTDPSGECVLKTVLRFIADSLKNRGGFHTFYMSGPVKIKLACLKRWKFLSLRGLEAVESLEGPVFMVCLFFRHKGVLKRTVLESKQSILWVRAGLVLLYNRLCLVLDHAFQRQWGILFSCGGILQL